MKDYSNVINKYTVDGEWTGEILDGKPVIRDWDGHPIYVQDVSKLNNHVEEPQYDGGELLSDTRDDQASED